LHFYYETGLNNPWGSTSSDAAMDSAFGVNNWIKDNGFVASPFEDSSNFIY